MWKEEIKIENNNDLGDKNIWTSGGTKKRMNIRRQMSHK